MMNIERKVRDVLTIEKRRIEPDIVNFRRMGNSGTSYVSKENHSDRRNMSDKCRLRCSYYNEIEGAQGCVIVPFFTFPVAFMLPLLPTAMMSAALTGVPPSPRLQDSCIMRLMITWKTDVDERMDGRAKRRC